MTDICHVRLNVSQDHYYVLDGMNGMFILYDNLSGSHISLGSRNDMEFLAKEILKVAATPGNQERR